MIILKDQFRTIECNCSIRVSQGIFGYTLVVHEVFGGHISNSELHVDFIATHNSQSLVFRACNKLASFSDCLQMVAVT